MKLESNDRLLTRDEVDERFGIPKRFLEICVMHKTGPRIVRIGRLVRYRAQDIYNWIDRNSSGEEG